MEKKYTLKDSWEQSLNWDEETDSESALNKAMLLSITDTEHLSMFDDDSLYDLSIIPTGSQMENKSYSFESTESTSRLSMFKGYVKKECTEVKSYEGSFSDENFLSFDNMENKKDDREINETPQNVPLSVLLRHMLHKIVEKGICESKQLKNFHTYNNEIILSCKNDLACRPNNNVLFTPNSAERENIINWDLLRDVEHRRNDEEFSNKIEKRNTMWQNLPELKDALESFSFNNTANSPSTSSELSSAFTSTIFSKEKLITIFEGTNESTSTSCLPDWSAECLVRMIRAIKKA